jgi:5-methylcytosine-specific restriction endonuclease McrA
MFDCSELPGAHEVASWVRRLGSSDGHLDDVARIDQIRALEELKCAAEAAQAVLSADFDTSQRAEQAHHGVPAERQGRGVAAQIALARRESPHRGQQHLGLAKILTAELPHTLAAFRAGRVTEWRATLVARETACLSLEDRLTVDAELAGNPERFEAMGDGELVAEARTIAYRLDPESLVARRSKAERERRVSLRPAPDVMSQLSALLPLKDGVAVHAVLTREANRLRAAGDERSRGQIMADTLVQRVLSTDPATDTRPAVMINVVVSDQILLGDSDDPAHVEDYGPIPADLARELSASTRAWVRRLYAAPETGRLVAMDSTARLMPDQLARMIRLRDQRCRTRWCDAPIRQSDHVRAVAEGGETSEPNGQGLCEACNRAKQAPGWRARPSPDEVRHTVETTTPTGHSYTSTAPAPIRSRFIQSRPGVWTLVA